MKTWVKGSLIGLLVGLSLVIADILFTLYLHFLDVLALWPPFFLTIIFGVLGLCNSVICRMEGFSWFQILVIPLSYGVIGAFIGWAMGKIKNRKKYP